MNKGRDIRLDWVPSAYREKPDSDAASQASSPAKQKLIYGNGPKTVNGKFKKRR